MLQPLLLAALVIGQAVADAPEPPMISDAPAPVAAEADGKPGLHAVVHAGRKLWVWSVPLPDGRFRPVEYAPTPAPERPSFETNGVVASALTGDGRILRASDPATLAEVGRVVEEARKKTPDRPCRPDQPCDPSDELDRIRNAAAAALRLEELAWYGLSGGLLLLGGILLVVVFRRRNP